MNECQIGIGAQVIKRTGSILKRLGGTLSFGIAALCVVPTGYHCKLRIHADGRTLEGDYFGMTLANGPLTGGSMQLAPGAQFDDGLLDVVCFRRTTIIRQLQTLSRIYSGKHIGTSGIEYFRCRHLAIESKDPVAIAVDGELIGALPCAISLIPAALKVLVQTNS